MQIAQYKLPIIRLLTGVLQGVLLYFLYLSADLKSWPATKNFLFIPILMIAAFIPIIIIQGLSNIRFKTLITWVGVLFLILIGIAYYHVWCTAPLYTNNARSSLESTPFLFFLIIIVFISHILIWSADNDRKLIANYTTYFDFSWKLAIQLFLTIFFVAILWLLFILGVGLFDLINIDLPKRFINKSWFAIPVTALAITISLHITDVSVSLIYGVRSLTLILLSWLLPLIAFIVAIFLFSLFFTGLTPLWQTKYPAKILLVAAGAIVFLINAAYQDGKKLITPILRYTTTISSLLILPLVLIAVYALSIRIHQYGWSSTRIIGAAYILIAAAYGVGYIVAALKPGPWLKFIEICNVSLAILTVFILLAFLTPVANPDKLAVINQLARLKAGIVVPEKFDFNYLRWHTHEIGKKALINIAANEHESAIIRERAKLILAEKYETFNNIKPFKREDKINFHPANSKLPNSFLTQENFNPNDNFRLPSCLHGYSKCDAWIAEFNHKQLILIFEEDRFFVFTQHADGLWQLSGLWLIPPNCTQIKNEILNGQFSLSPPLIPQWPDLEIAKKRFPFISAGQMFDCPK